MRALLFLLLITACTKSDAAPETARSSCREEAFDGSRFTVCAERGGKVEIRNWDSKRQPYRSFASLQATLGNHANRVAFAMNAGMYGEDRRAIGLLIEDGRELRAINRRKGGGNFHLMPNGIFLVRRDGSAAVVTSQAFNPSRNILFATQSGPMLVIDGNLHPAFEHDGTSRHVRNGVGIAPDGTPVFVISAGPVSLGKFARFYRDQVKARNALFFDGAVSSLWDPAGHRMDSHTEFGPIAVAFKAGASKPGREGPARP